jgi:hypothetical protein
LPAVSTLCVMSVTLPSFLRNENLFQFRASPRL